MSPPETSSSLPPSVNSDLFVYKEIPPISGPITDSSNRPQSSPEGEMELFIRDQERKKEEAKELFSGKYKELMDQIMTPKKTLTLLESAKHLNWNNISADSVIYIYALQYALRYLHYDNLIGKPDGILRSKDQKKMGKKSGTQQALEMFQRDNGLAVDGFPGSEVIERIIELMGWARTKRPEIESESREVLVTPERQASSQRTERSPVSPEHQTITPSQRAKRPSIPRSAPERQTTLNPENQRIFIEMVNGNFDNVKKLTQINPEMAKLLPRDLQSLWLDNITTIDSETAQNLPRKLKKLSMNSLFALSPEVAKELPRGLEWLSVNGLRTVSAEAINELAITIKYFYLNGVRKINIEALLALLEMPNLIEVVDGIALSPDKNKRKQELLSKVFFGKLIGIGVLSPENQKIYTEMQNGNFEHIDQLTQLTPRMAEMISGRREELSASIILPSSKDQKSIVLNGIKSLPPESAKKLSDQVNMLSLNGLIGLLPETAKELPKSLEWLSLNGLSTISSETVKELPKNIKYLFLYGIKKINTDTIDALARMSNLQQLNGVILKNTSFTKRKEEIMKIFGGRVIA